MEYTLNLHFFFLTFGAERDSKDNPVPSLYFTDEATNDHKPGLSLYLPNFNMLCLNISVPSQLRFDFSTLN